MHGVGLFRITAKSASLFLSCLIYYDLAVYRQTQLRQVLLIAAKQLHPKSKDHEYVHIFVHLYEIINSLDQIKVIHADFKLVNLVSYAVTKSSVLFDFRESWVYMNSLLCLDPFKRNPRTFEDRSDSELDSIRRIVLLYSFFLFTAGLEVDIKQGE
jgi:hypothetical protein